MVKLEFDISYHEYLSLKNALNFAKFHDKDFNLSQLQALEKFNELNDSFVEFTNDNLANFDINCRCGYTIKKGTYIKPEKDSCGILVYKCPDCGRI